MIYIKIQQTSSQKKKEAFQTKPSQTLNFQQKMSSYNIYAETSRMHLKVFLPCQLKLVLVEHICEASKMTKKKRKKNQDVL